jgi:hypothetical protein
MNITFDLQELAQLLSKALGCGIQAENIHFTDDDCVTLTEVSIETITKAAQATQTAQQPTNPRIPATWLPPEVRLENHNEPVEESPAANNFDDVMKASQQIAQLASDESKEFPAEFMQEILNKIR